MSHRTNRTSSGATLALLALLIGGATRCSSQGGGYARPGSSSPGLDSGIASGPCQALEDASFDDATSTGCHPQGSNTGCGPSVGGTALQWALGGRGRDRGPRRATTTVRPCGKVLVRLVHGPRACLRGVPFVGIQAQRPHGKKVSQASFHGVSKDARHVSSPMSVSERPCGRPNCVLVVQPPVLGR